MDVSHDYLIRILLFANAVAVIIVIGVAVERYMRQPVRKNAAPLLPRPGHYGPPGPTLNIPGDTRTTVPGGFAAPNYLYRMTEVTLA